MLPKGYSAPRSGVMLSVLVVGVPIIIGVHFVSVTLFGVTSVSYFAKLILWGSVIVWIPELARSVPKIRGADPRLWMGMFFATLTVSTVLGLGSRSYESPLDTLRCLASTAIWCSGLIAIPIIARAQGRSVAQVARALEWLGYLAATTIMCTMLFPSLAKYGFEVIEYQDGSSRYFGPMGDSSPFLVLPGLFISLTTRKWFACAMCVLAVMLTASRSASIVAAIGLSVHCVLGSLYNSEKSRRSIFVTIVSIVALIVVIMVTVPTYKASMVKLWSRNVSAVEDVQDDRLGGRLNNIDAGWELWQERPVFGWGIGGNFESVRTDGMGSSYSTGQIVGNATNQIVQAAAEGGVFGFTAFTVFLAAVAMMGWKQISGRRRRGREAQGVALFCLASVVGIQTVVYVRDLSLVGYVLCIAIGCLVLNEFTTDDCDAGQRAAPRARCRTHSDV